MASEEIPTGFSGGRAILRDTAKWLVSGTAAVIALMVGSSTISQLGSMEMNWRFYTAIASLIVGAGLCWFPFVNAVAVLQPDLRSLRSFVDENGILTSAGSTAESKLKPDLENLTLYELAFKREALREDRYLAAGGAGQEAADEAVASFDALVDLALEACLSEQLVERFETLKRTIAFPGVLIVVSFLYFSWAANPPKETVKIFERPYSIAVSPANIGRLRMLGVPTNCIPATSTFLVMGSEDSGQETAFLATPGCLRYAVTLKAGVAAKAVAEEPAASN